MLDENSTELCITVAVCTWNRAELLRQTLTSYTRMRVPAGVNLRLLVVNNNCTDSTNDVVQEFAPRLPLTCAFEATPGLSNARNRALNEAHAAGSDYIIYTDDDVLVSPEWLESFASAARRYPSATAFGGPIEPWFAIEPDPDLLAAFPNLRVGFCGLDHNIPEGLISDRPDISTENLIYGANMAFALRRLGDIRFDPSMGAVHDVPMLGDETIVLLRLRERKDEIVWVPRMRLKHYVPASRMTLDYLLPYYEGIGRTQVKLYGDYRASAILGVPRWVLRKSSQAAARWLWHAVRRRRAPSLVALREYRYYVGMLKEYRAGAAGSRP